MSNEEKNIYNSIKMLKGKQEEAECGTAAQGANEHRLGTKALE